MICPGCGQSVRSAHPVCLRRVQGRAREESNAIARLSQKQRDDILKRINTHIDRQR